jgi:hypothetical protein
VGLKASNVSSCSPPRRITPFLSRAYRHALGSLATLLLLVTFASPASAVRVVDGALASEAYIYQFWLDPNDTVNFSTFSSVGGDPVLHLFYRGSNGAGGFTWIQVASNDTHTTGVEASVTWQNGGSVKSMLLLVRGKAPDGAEGFTNLRRDGAVFRYYVPLGGRFMSPHGFTWGSGDHLRTAQRPGGSTAQVLVRFSDSPGLLASELGLLNSVARSASVTMASPTPAVFVATPFIEQEGEPTPLTYRDGLVDLRMNDFRMNDVSTDLDGDGVGNALEGALDTCASVWACAYNYFPWDTDRDGLSDLEEIFGLVSPDDPAEDVALPRWGAKPRRKDVFVEVDHLAEPDEAWAPPLCPAGDDPFQCLRDHPGLDIFGAYNHDGALDTLEGWVDAIRTPFLDGSAAALKNPDGSQGLAVHLDLGVPPLEASLADEAHFGDYGSPSSRRVVRDWYLELDAKADGPPPYDILYVVNAPWLSGGFVFGVVAGATPGESYASWMTRLATALASPATGLVFREMRIEPEPAVDKVVGRLRVRSGDAREVFDIVVLVVNGNNATDLDGRFRHGPEGAVGDPDYRALASGRLHYADEQFDPVRRKKFRYAVISTPGSAGTAPDGGMMSGTVPESFVHELGHLLGLRHWGRTEWHQGGVGHDMECLPQYRSIMSYAYTSANRDDPAQYPVRFNTTELLTFNPFRAFESGDLFGAGTSALPFHDPPLTHALHFWDMTKHPWFHRHAHIGGRLYWSALPGSGSLDQNRSAGIAGAGSAAPSLGHVARDASCRSFTAGAVLLQESPGVDIRDVTGTVDLVRVGSWLYGFYARNDPEDAARSGLWMVRAALGALSDKSCAGSADPWIGSTPCLTWSTPLRLATGARAHASAQLFNGALFVTSTHASTGDIYMTRYTPQANGSLSFHSYPQRPPGPLQSHRALGAPELTVLHGYRRTPELALVWRTREEAAPYEDAILVRRYLPATNAFTVPEFQRPAGGAPGVMITAGDAPSALPWPSPENPNLLAQEKRRTVAIFPVPTDEAGCRMFVLCNDASCCEDTGDGCCGNPLCTPPPQPWVATDYFGGTGLQEGMRCHSKTGMAYRQPRELNGQPISGYRGHVMLSMLHRLDNDGLRRVRIGLSEWTSDSRLPGHTTPGAAWRASPLLDHAQNSWHGLPPEGNAALYTDPGLANVFGLAVTGGDRNLEFWPHADAAPDHNFAVGNDFRVMEGETCRVLDKLTDAYQLVKYPQGNQPPSTADGYCGPFSVQSLLP